MPDLSDLSIVESELAATATYAVDRDVSLAKRRAAALEQKLLFASSSSRDSQSIAFDMRVIQSMLNQVYGWLEANEDASEDARKANPSVVHADFSGFGQYGGRHGA